MDLGSVTPYRLSSNRMLFGRLIRLWIGQVSSVGHEDIDTPVDVDGQEDVLIGCVPVAGQVWYVPINVNVPDATIAGSK